METWLLSTCALQVGVVEKAMHLHILWRFLSCMPLSTAGSLSVTALVEQVRTHWWRAMSAARSPPGVCAAAPT